MSTLKALLKDVPVEWKALGGIVTTKTAPSKIKREHYCLSGANPIIDQGAQFIAGYTDVNFPMVEKNEYIIFGDHSEHIKYVDFSFIQGADGLKILNSKNNNIKYLYYCFLSFYEKEGSYQRHWTKAKETLIPIPYPNDPEKSLAIQQKIVRVLDGLSEQNKALTTALAQEIDQRKKQYEYYREELFRFEGKEVEWKTLGSECDVLTGGEAPTNCIKGTMPIDEYQYPIFGNGVEIYGFTNTYRVDKDAVTISSIGANTGSIYFRSAFFTPIIRLKVVLPKFDNLKPKFLYHYLSTVTIASKSSSIPNMNASDVKKIKVPLVTIQEQERIVHLLDQFDEATKNIVAQLEKEIELRNKQYEYYRNLLLSFPN